MYAATKVELLVINCVQNADSSDRDEPRLKITRDVTMSRDYERSWYPPRYNSLKTSSPQRCLTYTSTTATAPVCSSVGRVHRPMAAGRANHVTPSGRNHQVPPVTSSYFTDDVRYRLLYGANVVPTVHHSVIIATLLLRPQKWCEVL